MLSKRFIKIISIIICISFLCQGVVWAEPRKSYFLASKSNVTDLEKLVRLLKSGEISETELRSLAVDDLKKLVVTNEEFRKAVEEALKKVAGPARKILEELLLLASADEVMQHNKEEVPRYIIWLLRKQSISVQTMGDCINKAEKISKLYGRINETLDAYIVKIVDKYNASISSGGKLPRIVLSSQNKYGVDLNSRDYPFIYSLFNNSGTSRAEYESKDHINVNEFGIGKGCKLIAEGLTSCTAVFIYDPKTKMGALIHAQPFPLWGEEATKELFDEVITNSVNIILGQMIANGANINDITSATLRSRQSLPEGDIDYTWSESIIIALQKSGIRNSSDFPLYAHAIETIEFDLGNGSITVNPWNNEMPLCTNISDISSLSQDVSHIEALKVKGGKAGLWVKRDWWNDGAESNIAGDAVKSYKKTITDSFSGDIKNNEIIYNGNLKVFYDTAIGGLDANYRQEIEDIFIDEVKRMDFSSRRSLLSQRQRNFDLSTYRVPLYEEVFVVAVLQDSDFLGEDHFSNGFIGINQRLFEIQDTELRQKLLRLILRHELRHECGETDESVLLAGDIKYAKELGIVSDQLLGLSILDNDFGMSLYISLKKDEQGTKLLEQLLREEVNADSIEQINLLITFLCDLSIEKGQKERIVSTVEKTLTTNRSLLSAINLGQLSLLIRSIGDDERDVVGQKISSIVKLVLSNNPSLKSVLLQQAARERDVKTLQFVLIEDIEVDIELLKLLANLLINFDTRNDGLKERIALLIYKNLETNPDLKIGQEELLLFITAFNNTSNNDAVKRIIYSIFRKIMSENPTLKDFLIERAGIQNEMRGRIVNGWDGIERLLTIAGQNPILAEYIVDKIIVTMQYLRQGLGSDDDFRQFNQIEARLAEIRAQLFSILNNPNLDILTKRRLIRSMPLGNMNQLNVLRQQAIDVVRAATGLFDSRDGLIGNIRNNIHNNPSPQDLAVMIAYKNWVESNGVRDVDTLRRLGYMVRPFDRVDPSRKAGTISACNILIETLTQVYGGQDAGSGTTSLRGPFDEWSRVIVNRADDVNFIRGSILNATNNSLDALRQIVSARERLRNIINTSSSEVLYQSLKLDIHLELLFYRIFNSIRRNYDNGRENVELLKYLIANAVLNGHSEDELGNIKKELENFVFTDNKGSYLRFYSMIRRIERLLGSSVEGVALRYEELAEATGIALNVPEVAREAFCPDLFRSDTIYLLSLALGEIKKSIMEKGNISGWEVVVPGTMEGKLHYIDDISKLSEVVEGEILVIPNLPAEGQPVLGIKGIITLSEESLLSHPAIRARQHGIPYAVCPNVEAIRTFFGKQVSVTITDMGAQIKEETFATASRAPPAAKTAITIPPAITDGNVIILPEEYSQEKVGNKAYRLNKSLRGDIKVKNLTLGFGLYNFLVNLPENQDKKAQIEKLKSEIRLMKETEAERIEAMLKQIRECIELLIIPDNLIAEISESIVSNVGDGLVFLRSSTNAEDLDDYAGAGLYDSYGSINPADKGQLAMYAKKVLASVWSSRAFFDREVNKVDHESVHMAVLVCQMIPADYSFVVHTTNPSSSSADEVVIELVQGLGESLVSGTYVGAPHRYIYNKRTNELTHLSYANKDYKVVSENGVMCDKLVDYSEDIFTNDTTEAQAMIRAILREALDISATQFQGKPQDVEGCIRKERETHKFGFVQSRDQQITKQVTVASTQEGQGIRPIDTKMQERENRLRQLLTEKGYNPDKIESMLTRINSVNEISKRNSIYACISALVRSRFSEFPEFKDVIEKILSFGDEDAIISSYRSLAVVERSFISLIPNWFTPFIINILSDEATAESKLFILANYAFENSIFDETQDDLNGVIQGNGAGFDNMDNEEYTLDIRKGLGLGKGIPANFASVKYDKRGQIMDANIGISAPEDKKLQEGERKNLLTAINMLDKETKELLAQLNIVFIPGISAHYGKTRLQIYLDRTLLQNEQTQGLFLRLRHEVKERNMVVNQGKDAQMVHKQLVIEEIAYLLNIGESMVKEIVEGRDLDLLHKLRGKLMSKTLSGLKKELQTFSDSTETVSRSLELVDGLETVSEIRPEELLRQLILYVKLQGQKEGVKASSDIPEAIPHTRLKDAASAVSV